MTTPEIRDAVARWFVRLFSKSAPIATDCEHAWKSLGYVNGYSDTEHVRCSKCRKRATYDPWAGD